MSTEPLELARVQHERDAARGSIARGTMMLLLIPIAFAVAMVFGETFDSFGPLIVAALYAIAGGAVGVVSLGAGTVRLRITSRQLHRIEAERIPPARLVT